MKIKTLVFVVAVIIPVLASASITDPVTDFKSGLAIKAGDKILKWVCDMSGGGKNEVLLCLKSDFDNDVDDQLSPSWNFYISKDGKSFQMSSGVENSPGTLSHILPQIDPDLCFIGRVTELGKRGLVTISYTTPRSGITTAIIYAYTIEGDHLKRTQLAKYDPDKGSNAIFNKYLADDKRTHVTLQEIAP